MQTKQIITVLLIATLLAACAPAVNAPAPTATSVHLPTVTQPPTLTPLPTATATATLTPTPNPTPTSQQIAFASNELGNWNLYRANLDGKGMTQLTLYEDDDIRPVWSPDGLKLVYQIKQGLTWQIMLMGWDGNDMIQLTNEGNNQNPSWSPDGSRIVFDSDRKGNRDIFQMDLKGENLQALTEGPSNEFAPVWAPDGTMLAYLSEQDVTQEECSQNTAGACPQEIFFMDAKGAFLRKVTGLKRNIAGLNWSPDSQSLAAVVAYFEKSEIAVYDIKSRKLKPSLDLSALLEYIYQTGPGDFYLRSFAYSPKGNNAVFCAKQDIRNKNGLRTIYSGCYLTSLNGGVVFGLIRKETPVLADTDLENAVDYSGAVWRP